jgi:serine protease Do
VFSGSPAENAGIRANDIIVAIDGVPIRGYDDAATKVRLTAIGQQMAITVERNGAIEDHSLKIARCLVREAPRAPGAQPACQSWIN